MNDKLKEFLQEAIGDFVGTLDGDAFFFADGLMHEAIRSLDLSEKEVLNSLNMARNINAQAEKTLTQAEKDFVSEAIGDLIESSEGAGVDFGKSILAKLGISADAGLIRESDTQGEVFCVVNRAEREVLDALFEQFYKTHKYESRGWEFEARLSGLVDKLRLDHWLIDDAQAGTKEAVCVHDWKRFALVDCSTGRVIAGEAGGYDGESLVAFTASYHSASYALTMDAGEQSSGDTVFFAGDENGVEIVCSQLSGSLGGAQQALSECAFMLAMEARDVSEEGGEESQRKAHFLMVLSDELEEWVK